MVYQSNRDTLLCSLTDETDFVLFDHNGVGAAGSIRARLTKKIAKTWRRG